MSRFSGGLACRCVLRTEAPSAAHQHISQLELSVRAFKASRGKREGTDLGFINVGVFFFFFFSYEQGDRSPRT